jgi:hypothetical protein
MDQLTARSIIPRQQIPKKVGQVSMKETELDLTFPQCIGPTALGSAYDISADLHSVVFWKLSL